MKSLLSILVVFSLILQVVAKASLLTYYFVNKRYYTEVLCENKDKPQLNCNGTCVLSQQLRNTQPIHEVPNIPMGLQEVKEMAPCIIYLIDTHVLFDLKECGEFFTRYLIQYSFTYIKEFYIPPTLLV